LKEHRGNCLPGKRWLSRTILRHPGRKKRSLGVTEKITFGETTESRKVPFPIRKNGTAATSIKTQEPRSGSQARNPDRRRGNGGTYTQHVRIRGGKGEKSLKGTKLRPKRTDQSFGIGGDYHRNEGGPSDSKKLYGVGAACCALVIGNPENEHVFPSNSRNLVVREWGESEGIKDPYWRAPNRPQMILAGRRKGGGHVCNWGDGL